MGRFGQVWNLPYMDRDFNNGVDVVGHDAERVWYYMGIMIGQIQPCFFYYFAIIVQYHFPVDDISEYAFPVFHTYCNEI